MRKLAAIMFSDITGYSAMMAKDEKHAMAVLERNRGIHKSYIKKYKGQYIKEIGDGTLAIFQSALDAVICAIHIRNACSSGTGHVIRIGIHLGDVIIKENDVFGDSVNIASRIESVGEPGGIFISEKVYDDIKNKEGISVDFYDKKTLKNIPDPVKIYRITSLTGPDKLEANYDLHVPGSQQIFASRNAKWIIVFGILFAFIILVAVLILNPGILRKDVLKNVRSADGKISLAVMPFYNMTSDSTWNVWQEGIQDMLINSLSNSNELKVRQFESVNNLLHSKGNLNYAKLTPELAGNISQKLDAGVFIIGNFKIAGQSLRISAKLIDSKTREILRTFQIDGDAQEKNIFPVIDSLIKTVHDFLLISQMESELTPDYQRIITTKSPEAYRYFISGKNAFMKRDFRLAGDYFRSARQVDSNFTLAGVFLAIVYGNQGMYDEAKVVCRMISQNKSKESYQMQVMINWCNALYFETPNEELIYCKQLIEIDNQNPMFYYQLGYTYRSLFQYDKAIPAYEKALEIYNKWETKPDWIYHYTGLIESYFKTGQLEKASLLCEKAIDDFPGESSVLYWAAVTNLALGDTLASNNYIEELLLLWRNGSRPENRIALSLGNIYKEAGWDDRAEIYFRQALGLKPDDIYTLNTLGYFLADKERNIDEGLALLTKALEMAPEDYYLMDSKGWALYRKGKLSNALELIEKSNQLRPIYNHAIYLHLQEVRQALAKEN